MNQSKETVEFLTFLKGLHINYTILLLQNPDVFPELLPAHDEFEGPALSAFRIVQLVEESGCPTDFLKEINEQLK